MDKSPISALQEFCIKEGHVPNYIFMTANNNNSRNQFVCKVACKNLSTTGSGSNKKEAKHNAAQTMLSLLLGNNNTSVSPLRQRYRNVDRAQDFTKPDIYETCSDVQDNINTYSLLKAQVYPAMNYVGLLQEHCVRYRLNVIPSYKVIGECGPSHMKIFTVESSIGTLRETGKAHCKRSAKQEAAKNLLQRLRSLNILSEDKIEKCEDCKWIREDDGQKLDLEIFDVEISKPTIDAADLPKKPDYIGSNNNVHIENLPVKNNHTGFIPIESPKENGSFKRMLMDDLQKLNIEILDAQTYEPTMPVTKLSDVAQPVYVKSVTNNVDMLSLSVENCATDLVSVEPFKKNENSRKHSLENDLWKLNAEVSSLEISEPVQPIIKPSKKVQSVLSLESITDNKDMQNFSVRNKRTSISVKENENYKCIFEEDFLRNLNKGIPDLKINESTLPVAKLSKQAESIYFASTSRSTGARNCSIKDHHSLFKRKYSSKISDNLREKMKNISELNNYRSYKITQIKQDIQTALGVQLKQIKFSNCETGLTIICVRMLSTPIITQFGIGKTTLEAENRAMYEIINTVIDLLK